MSNHYYGHIVVVKNERNEANHPQDINPFIPLVVGQKRWDVRANTSGKKERKRISTILLEEIHSDSLCQPGNISRTGNPARFKG